MKRTFTFLTTLLLAPLAVHSVVEMTAAGT
jgi:hypothetical protein